MPVVAREQGPPREEISAGPRLPHFERVARVALARAPRRLSTIIGIPPGRIPLTSAAFGLNRALSARRTGAGRSRPWPAGSGTAKQQLRHLTCGCGVLRGVAGPG